ncbi:hypothetical protein CDL12_08996 [Handroanthus impetiginosus]|uniref:Phytocyanin domain-containing protein n=1 Tax=Handroanthus impetiginosus TaxID=429701 RepID=A0A2G9HLC0_9LAMI|nr:hypothetical protein CDL12_08996 [Handroanthus impetiginosus]
MKMIKTVVCLATIAIFSMNMAKAANYTVGGTNGGWDQATDLATWASSQTFFTGDNLIFTYAINHDVTEVSKGDFASCSASNPLEPSHTGGSAVITLTSAGRRYFICSTAGHCVSGMKVEINTLASAPSPSTTTSLPPPPEPATPPPSLPPSPPTATPPIQSQSPTPSVHRPAPSPSPKHPHSPAPKVSPSSPLSKAATPVSNPAMPPTSTPSRGGSLLLPPAHAPSSAARSNVMGAVTAACSAFVMMMFLNL